MQPVPATMTAAGFEAPGGPEVLRAETLPVPAPGPGQVLVRVAYAGVNRPDVIQRQGFYPPPPGASPIPGLEISGQVVAVGEGVTDPLPGQKVCALVAGGGYAEYCLTEAGLCLPVPERRTRQRSQVRQDSEKTAWNLRFEGGYSSLTPSVRRLTRKATVATATRSNRQEMSMKLRSLRIVFVTAAIALLVGVRIGSQGGGGSNNTGAMPPASIPTFSTENLGRMAHFYVGGHYVGEGDKQQMDGAMYVEVWVPKQIRQQYPIVMFHGNGHTGAVRQQTPDGRPGWAYYLINQGYVVYKIGRAHV